MMRPKRIKFDPSFYAMTLLAIFLGYLNEYIIFALTILVHECGHLMMAAFYNWRFEQIKFFAFGGIMEFQGELNKSNVEDFVVSSGGIVFNFLCFLLLILARERISPYVNLTLYDYAIGSQLFVIFFNLTPLPPLDGSRLLNAFLCCYFPYKVVLKIMKIINIVLIVLFMAITFFNDFRQIYLVMSFLVYSTIKYNKQIYFLFQRFLLQKRMYTNVDLPNKIIKFRNDSLEDNFYRGYFNTFQINHRLHDETSWLRLKYEENTALSVDAPYKTD